MVAYIWGKKYSCSPVELSSLGPCHQVVSSLVFNAICPVYGHPHIDQLTEEVKARLHSCVSLVPGPIVWKQEDAFQH